MSSNPSKPTLHRLTINHRKEEFFTDVSGSMPCCFVMLIVMTVLAGLPANAAQTLTLEANRDVNILKSTFSGTGSGRQINDVNLGGTPRLQVGNAGNDDTRSLIDFDFSPLAGQYQQINSITLRFTYDLDVQIQDFSKAIDINVHKISLANADWVEGTGVSDGNAGDDTGATWRHKDRATDNWAGGTGTTATGGLISSGVDFESTLLAALSVGPTLPSDGQEILILFDDNNDLTALMDSLIEDSSGFLLSSPTAGLVANRDRLRLASRDVANSALRPQLIVEFQPVPEPSTVAIWLLLGAAAITTWWCRQRRSAGRRCPG